jgi:flavin-dependent dehydrogenase
VGVAAGFINPSSLEGISYALESAAGLAGAILKPDGRHNVSHHNASHPDDGNPRTDKVEKFPLKAIHRAYRRASFRMALKLFVKSLKSPFMYNPVLRFLVMKSGIPMNVTIRNLFHSLNNSSS